MSQIYKCNRCGTESSRYMTKLNFTSGDNPLTYKLINYDICDKCTKELVPILIDWVEKYGQNIEYHKEATRILNEKA